MSHDPERWPALARAAIRAKFPDSWRTDEMVAAAIERFAKLHAQGKLPAQPSRLVAIARFAGIDELRRLEGSRQGEVNASRQWAVSLDGLQAPSGDPIDFRDPDAHEFADRVVEQIVAATRAGVIRGVAMTARERRMVRLLATGATQAETAARMGIPASNVSQCIDQLVSRLEDLTT